MNDGFAVEYREWPSRPGVLQREMDGPALWPCASIGLTGWTFEVPSASSTVAALSSAYCAQKAA